MRLSDEVNALNEELSRYMSRFHEEEAANNIRPNKHPNKHLAHMQPVHYNSDRRVDYRKHRRKKELAKEQPQSHHRSYSGQHESSSSEDEVAPICHQPMPSTSSSSLVKLRNKDPSIQSQRIVYRNHERLFDKKIVNKKRFSQVVMLDEDEIFQMNQEIPTFQSSGRGSRDNTLKASNNHNHIDDSCGNSTQNYYSQQRPMEYVPEEDGNCSDGRDDSFDDRIKPGQFLADDLTADVDAAKDRKSVV